MRQVIIYRQLTQLSLQSLLINSMELTKEWIIFCFSVEFIHNYFKSTPNHKPLCGLVPSHLVIAGFVVSWLVTTTSETRLCCNHGWHYRILHIAIGGVCLLIVAGFVFIKEKTLVNFVLQHWFGIRKKKEE